MPSHFNTSTPLDSLIFTGMAISIAEFVVDIIVITVLAIGKLTSPPSLALDIRAGLLILLVSQAIGGVMIGNGRSVLAEEQVTTPAHTSRDPSIMGEKGALKLPHAITIHGLQILPLLAWLGQLTRWPERRRVRAVAAATAGYGLLDYLRSGARR